MDIVQQRFTDAARLKAMRRAIDEEVGAQKLFTIVGPYLTPEGLAKAKAAQALLAKAAAAAKHAWEQLPSDEMPADAPQPGRESKASTVARVFHERRGMLGREMIQAAGTPKFYQLEAQLIELQGLENEIAYQIFYGPRPAPATMEGGNARA